MDATGVHRATACETLEDRLGESRFPSFLAISGQTVPQQVVQLHMTTRGYSIGVMRIWS